MKFFLYFFFINFDQFYVYRYFFSKISKNIYDIFVKSKYRYIPNFLYFYPWEEKKKNKWWISKSAFIFVSSFISNFKFQGFGFYLFEGIFGPSWVIFYVLKRQDYLYKYGYHLDPNLNHLKRIE